MSIILLSALANNCCITLYAADESVGVSNGVHQYKRQHLFTGHGNAVQVLEPLLNYSGNVISGSCDRRLKQWNLETGQWVRDFTEHHGPITAITSCDNTIISGSSDRTIKMWHLNNQHPTKTLEDYDSGITALTYIDDKTFASAYGCTIKIWDIRNLNEPFLFKYEREKIILALASFVLEGQSRLVVGTQSSEVGILDRANNTTAFYKEHQDAVKSICIDSATNIIISGSADNTIKIWQPDENNRMNVAALSNDHQNTVTSVACGPNKTILSASLDKTTKIRDIHNDEVQQTITFPAPVMAVTHCDGTILSAYGNIIAVDR